MTIREITSSTQWEKFWFAHGSNALFQSWLWGETLVSRAEKIWRLGFYEGSELAGLALVHMVAAKRGRFLHIRHGPILTDQNWKEVLQHLRTIAATKRAWFVRISPLIQTLPLGLGLVPSPIHAMDAEFCWVLDLDSSEEELLGNMRKTTRYEIRRAQKMGVEVSAGRDENDLNHFIKLYQTTAKRQGFVGHSGIAEEYEVFFKADQAVLLLGKYQGEVTAGALILFSGDQAIYHHGASVHSEKPVSYLVQWEAIKLAKKRGMKVYNFWGIAPNENPNHPWRGLTLFKKGFGGREVRYIHSQDLPVNPLYVVPRSIESFRRFVKGY